MSIPGSLLLLPIVTTLIIVNSKETRYNSFLAVESRKSRERRHFFQYVTHLICAI